VNSEPASDRRNDAFARAENHSPFLRFAASAYPDVAQRFLAEGALAASALALETTGEGVEAELRRRRTALVLAIALGDLSGELSLEEVTRQLSDFADWAVEAAIECALAERFAGAEARGFAAIALGKLGSRELNFSSDIDLILLFDPKRLPVDDRRDPGETAVWVGRRVIELLQKRSEDGYVARVDLRLRPSPEVTPIVLPVSAAISYYESSATGWERAAFIRARCCAGDPEVGRQFLSAIEPFVWRRALDFGAIDEAQAISGQIRDHHSAGQKFGPGFDLKRGRGGIREVEFFAHAHQLVHGGREAELRAPTTLDALAALAGGGYVDPEVANELSEAYRRLRTAEHRVQMVEDRQTHLIPAGEAALANVAKLHGLETGGAFLDWLRPWVDRVGSVFDQLAGEESGRLPTDPGPLCEALDALGFPEPETAMRRIEEWRSGRPRSLRSSAAARGFEAMLPSLLKAIGRSADPMRALNRLSDVIESVPSGVNLYRLIEARPALATLLARILAHAPALSDQLARRPELLDSLLDSSCFEAPPPVPELARLLEEEMKSLPYDLALDRVRRLVNDRRFALGVQLIDLREDPLTVGRGYAQVAEAAIAALADEAIGEFEKTHGRFPGAELLILGLGRLGGEVMTNASDLDIVYLFTSSDAECSDGAKPLGPADYFNRLANRVSAALSVPTAAGPLYDVDTRLRPQGAQGMLAVSLDSFVEYQRSEAWAWEHMALTRARPVFGSQAAREAAFEAISSILMKPYDPIALAADAAKMRSDIALHKAPSGPLDVKLGPGGLIDLEFAIHVLQLTHKRGLHPNLGKAAQLLESDGLIDEKIVDAQKLLTKMLVTIRLVAPETTSPSEESCELMARAAGAQSWAKLLARHDEARHSVSALWEKVKAGKLT